MELAIFNFDIIYAQIKNQYYGENISYLDFRLEILSIYTEFFAIGRLSNFHEQTKKGTKKCTGHKITLAIKKKRCKYYLYLGKESNHYISEFNVMNFWIRFAVKNIIIIFRFKIR